MRTPQPRDTRSSLVVTVTWASGGPGGFLVFVVPRPNKEKPQDPDPHRPAGDFAQTCPREAGPKSCSSGPTHAGLMPGLCPAGQEGLGESPSATGTWGRGLLVMLPFSLLCPNYSKSPPSPARPSHLPLGSERATPTQQTPLPTAPSPAQLPPRPAGMPTPVSPTGHQGSVGGERGREFPGEPAEMLSEHPEFRGPSPKLPERWDKA